MSYELFFVDLYKKEAIYNVYRKNIYLQKLTSLAIVVSVNRHCCTAVIFLLLGFMFLPCIEDFNLTDMCISKPRKCFWTL